MTKDGDCQKNIAIAPLYEANRGITVSQNVSSCRVVPSQGAGGRRTTIHGKNQNVS